MDIPAQQCQISHRGIEVPVSYFIRPGSAGTLLYLHGLGASKRDFLGCANQDNLLNCTVAAFDFPGCGETPYPADRGWRVEDLMEITDQVVSALGLGRLVIAGHSLGGLVALLYARKYRAKVASIVNIEGNLGPEDCFLTREVARFSFPDFISTGHLQKLKLNFANAPHQGTRIWAEALGGQGTARAFHDYAVSIVDWSDNADLLGMFEALPIPKAFVYGSANNHLSYLTRLRKGDASIIEVPDRGHWPHVDNPRYFYRALAHFLDSSDHTNSEAD
jgi:pimeloyl-ACP methyl ester carboxylesterase